MKKVLTLILIFGTISTVRAKITVKVYEADGTTPFDCNQDVMVGVDLTIVVSSDNNDFWNGGLFIKGQGRTFGTLNGRGLDPNDPNARDYEDSHYEEAGDFAIVTGWKDSSIWGFDLYTFYPVDGNSDSNSSGTETGEWFIIDYEANEVGDCNVGFYDYSINWNEPNYSISFTNSPTRDLNADDIVDFSDFAIFAAQWNVNGCNEPGWCDGADLDRNGNVYYNDVELFVKYWLWQDSQIMESMMMGQGDGMNMNSQESYTQETKQSSGLLDFGIDEMISLLEELWLEEDSLSEQFSEDEWNEFIESLKNSDY